MNAVRTLSMKFPAVADFRFPFEDEPAVKSVIITIP